MLNEKDFWTWNLIYVYSYRINTVMITVSDEYW